MSGTGGGPTARRSGTADDAARQVPAGVRVVGMWCLWTLAIGAVVYFVLNVVVLLGTVVLTFLAGLLLTSVLRPVVSWLDRHGVNRLLATWLVTVGFLVFLAGVGWFLQLRLANQLSRLGPTLAQGLERIRTYLVETVGLSEQQVGAVMDALIAQVSPGGSAGSGGSGSAAGDLATGAMGGSAIVTGATTVVSVLVSVVLAVFTAFWLAYDGERLWGRALLVIPRSRRADVDHAGRAAWGALGGYLRGVTLVALLDALGIGIALVLIGVPLPFALALLTFLGAYIPVVGAFVAGLAAVVVAFAAGGLTDAALTLGAVFLVQQIEGNLLQPLIMRQAVRLHPLVVLYVLTVGGLLYGIAGAVVAVPVTAVLYAIGLAIAAQRNQHHRTTSRPRPARADDGPGIDRPPAGGATAAGGKVAALPHGDGARDAGGRDP